MRANLSTLALIVALFCFSVALALATGLFHGTNVAAWKDVGWMAIVVALLLGSRP